MLMLLTAWHNLDDCFESLRWRQFVDSLTSTRLHTWHNLRMARPQHDNILVWQELDNSVRCGPGNVSIGDRKKIGLLKAGGHQIQTSIQHQIITTITLKFSKFYRYIMGTGQLKKSAFRFRNTNSQRPRYELIQKMSFSTSDIGKKV